MHLLKDIFFRVDTILLTCGPIVRSSLVEVKG